MPDKTRKFFSSYYEVLQLPVDAAQEDIRRAYKALVKKYHPDHNPQYKALAHNRLKILKEAYEALKTPERRAAYDAARRPDAQGRGGWDKSLASMRADNDNPAVKPFPWDRLAQVGWSNLSWFFLPSLKRRGDKEASHGQ